VNISQPKLRSEKFDDDGSNNNNNNNNNNNKWKQAVQKDREVTANRTDTIIKNKKEKICRLTDMAIPAHRNVMPKEKEKRLKCKSLRTEVLLYTGVTYGYTYKDVM